MFGNNTSDNQHGTVSTTLFSRTYPCFLACPSLMFKGLLLSSWAFLTVCHRQRSVSRSRLSQAHTCLAISFWMLECLGPLLDLGLAGSALFLRVSVESVLPSSLVLSPVFSSSLWMVFVFLVMKLVHGRCRRKQKACRIKQKAGSHPHSCHCGWGFVLSKHLFSTFYVPSTMLDARVERHLTYDTRC